ncbi:3-hydroxyacyl-CoA dehydrogenase NAD-binding domain-containing protein [Lichenicoccus sp.]|uniref:3-hydroxyacyl-CoA dehydrogenase NAD-binding domain-containing protein n=1 Tax=Lichenicoccus sp. TaxID=2781899 RepID=UPI003D0DC56D
MIRIEQHGAVRVIVIENPPVNALGAVVRKGLARAVAEAQAAAGVDATVIRGAGRLFSGGADIREFTRPSIEPHLPEMLDVIEGGAKPVVAALHGTVFGGGLELALSCHYRVAAPSARLGLPEVKIGLLPGAGGTQRLPRLVGIEAALSMILSGDPVTAERAAALGLVDRVAAEVLLTEDAVAFALEVAAPGGARRTSARAVRVEEGAVERCIASQGDRLQRLDAPAACIQAIRYATELPFREGLARERALFDQLAAGRQSKALRHIFFAERACGKVDGLPGDVQPLPVASVGIVGAGTMGGGIAMTFLSAGIPVILVEREQAPLDRGVATIRRNYERRAARGSLTQAQVEAAMALLSPGLALDALAGCDLVIEVVFETMAAKQEVFRRLDGIAKHGAILASNTSYLDVDAIAAVTRRPAQVLGLHFFSPANVMRLLEVVRGAATSPAVLATAMALARRIGKVAVVSRVCHGFIGNRMLEPRQRQAERLVLEGARPQDVDRVLLEFGMPMGPFQMADLAGLDLGWEAGRSSGSTLREILCEHGRRGQKSGQGYYDYDSDRRRSPSVAVEALIRGFAERSGVAQRQVGDDEIRECLLYPMVDEAARILDEGVAQRASDIDVVWVNGYGWPAATGGPMFWADGIGLATIAAGLRRHGGDTAVSKALADRAAAGETFIPQVGR